MTRARFQRFRDVEASWLDDYALFVALKDAYNGAGWTSWDAALVRREPAALADAHRSLADVIEQERHMKCSCVDAELCPNEDGDPPKVRSRGVGGGCVGRMRTAGGHGPEEGVRAASALQRVDYFRLRRAPWCVWR